MDRAALVALVVGYENLIPKLTLPDENDRHVLAAAIRGRAQVIVTMNLKDFPAEVLQKYDTEAQHPDEFIRRSLTWPAGCKEFCHPGKVMLPAMLRNSCRVVAGASLLRGPSYFAGTPQGRVYPLTETESSLSRVSGYFRTSNTNAAAWGLGLERPCSHFSRVRSLARSFRANTALEQ